MTGMITLNLSRPPFRIMPEQLAKDAAADIVDAFKLIESQPGKVSRIFTTLIDRLGIGASSPLRIAGLHLATTIDEASSVEDKPYHNSQHTCEVMLSAYFLSTLAGIEPQESAEIVLAALAHDFKHDGKFNGDILFRLERYAVNETLPYLAAARMSESDQRKISALILATEIIIGGAIVQASYHAHSGVGEFPDIPVVVPELEQLCEDPQTSTQALILCEADLLPSIGLTVDYAFKLQDRLVEEWGAQLGPEDKLKDKLSFIDNQCHAFIVGDFFTPNVEMLRADILQKLVRKV